MFHRVTKKWMPNRAPTFADMAMAFVDCPIEDINGFMMPTAEDLLAKYYLSDDFTDHGGDAVTALIIEIWSQGHTILCSMNPIVAPNGQGSQVLMTCSVTLDGLNSYSS